MVTESGSTQEKTVSIADSPPSQAVPEAIADAEGIDPLDLPPLYETVDPDALDVIFNGRTSGSITFEYKGYSITIDQTDVVLSQE